MNCDGLVKQWKAAVEVIDANVRVDVNPDSDNGWKTNETWKTIDTFQTSEDLSHHSLGVSCHMFACLSITISILNLICIMCLDE